MSNQIKLSFRTNVKNLRSFAIFMVASISFAGFVLFAPMARAAGENCFIFSDLEAMTTVEEVSAADASCIFLADEDACRSTAEWDNKIFTFFATPGADTCADDLANFQTKKDLKIAAFNSELTAANESACFCWTDFPKEKQLTELDKIQNAQSSCNENVATETACQTTCGGSNYKLFTGVNSADSLRQCQVAKNKWEKDLAALKGSAGRVRAISSKFIPECLLTDELTAECRDIGIFVMLGINVARYLFGIVGALALLFFIYGGFILILSQGNPEKIQKGTGAIIAAIIGLAIVFAAYVLVNFLGETVGIRSDLLLF